MSADHEPCRFILRVIARATSVIAMRVPVHILEPFPKPRAAGKTLQQRVDFWNIGSRYAAARHIVPLRVDEAKERERERERENTVL